LILPSRLVWPLHPTATATLAGRGRGPCCFFACFCADSTVSPVAHRVRACVLQKWVKSAVPKRKGDETGAARLERGFCAFVLRPILNLSAAVLAGKDEVYSEFSFSDCWRMACCCCTLQFCVAWRLVFASLCAQPVRRICLLSAVCYPQWACLRSCRGRCTFRSRSFGSDSR
jgi:hypothetical protein